MVADKLRQHAGAIASSASPRAHPRFTCASGGMHAAVAGGEPAALQEGIVGQCAALHQIGYAWLHLAVHGRSDDMWPVSSQALPGAKTTPPAVPVTATILLDSMPWCRKERLRVHLCMPAL